MGDPETGGAGAAAAPADQKGDQQPTAPQLRGYADKLREQAKGDMEQAAKLRAEEKQLESRAAAVRNRAELAERRAEESVVAGEAAEARAARLYTQAGNRDRQGEADLEDAQKLETEAEKIEGTDPAKAADLKEEVQRLRERASVQDAESRKLLEQADQARDEAEAVLRTSRIQFDESSRLEHEYKQLISESEEKERQAEQIEETAAATEKEARRFETEAERLEAREQTDEMRGTDDAPSSGAPSSDAPPAPVPADAATGVATPAAELEEQTAVAEEVLASVKPVGEIDGELDIALVGAMDDASVDGASAVDDATLLAETHDAIDTINGDHSLAVGQDDMAMTGDELAATSLPDDELGGGGEFEDPDAGDPMVADVAPVDEMGDVEV